MHTTSDMKQRVFPADCHSGHDYRDRFHTAQLSNHSLLAKTRNNNKNAPKYFYSNSGGKGRTWHTEVANTKFKASIVEAKTNIPDFQKRKTINKPKLQCSQKCEIPAIYISIMELGYARPTDEPWKFFLKDMCSYGQTVQFCYHGLLIHCVHEKTITLDNVR